jgi:drug/metabolite transporter (DMT)-like permease
MHTPSSSSTASTRAPVWIALAFGYIYVVWGATYLAIHCALESMPPFLLAGSRFLLAGTMLLAALRLLHRERFHWGDAREWKDAAIVGTLLLVGGNGVVAWSQLFVPSSITALLFGSMPLWIILFDWLRPGGTMPTLRVCAGLLVGLVGVAVLMKPGAFEHTSPLLLWGEIALLLAACSWAAGGIYSRYVHAKGSPLLPMARQMIVGGVLLLAISYVHGDWRHFSFAQVRPVAWLGFGYLVVFGSLTGFTIYVWLMRVSTPAHVATISYANLLVAVALGWGVLHEPLTARLIVGGVIMVGSVVLVLKKPKEPAELIDE